MMTCHKLLVIASAIQGYVHQILRTVRDAENHTGPKLPDFTLCQYLHANVCSSLLVYITIVICYMYSLKSGTIGPERFSAPLSVLWAL